ncbi:hypothetical protein RJ640_003009 [Escallonia rubra]|uniref:GAG-pre-integrase domain-containing protein n=1 Tax=Escallonia rubra TaxID=112253 RepID=A0AA88R2P8_9ASTE|nr:hypothetical protein RJ640_003009 [Escallonia rubra]
MKVMLNEQELEEHLTTEMVAPTEAQPLRDHTAYQKWNQKDRSARYTLLSSLQNDLIRQYDELPTCKALWEQLKFSFGGTSTTRLRSLVIKFEEYTKDPKHTMSEHLRVTSNMIGKLRDAGHALTNEQQIRAGIRSLPASWANMKQTLNHSENIKNFSDVSQHVIFEAKTRDANKTLTYVAQKGSRNANGKRRKSSKKYEASTSAPKEGKMKKRKRGKHGGKMICLKTNASTDDVLFGHGFRMDSLFHLNLIDSQSSYSYVVNDNIVNDYTTWHARLGHIGQDRMTCLAKEGLFRPTRKVKLQTCEACLSGKACMKPFGKAVRATQALELVHSDICGPMSVKARHGSSYFLTLIDDYTRYGYVYLISHCYETYDCFKCFVAKFEEAEATLPSPSEGGKLVPRPVVAEDSVSDLQTSGSIPDSGSTPQGPLGQQDSQLRRAGNDMSSIVATKQWLSSTFEMKDMGEANYVLGVKITSVMPLEWALIEMSTDPLQVELSLGTARKSLASPYPRWIRSMLLEQQQSRKLFD